MPRSGFRRLLVLALTLASFSIASPSRAVAGTDERAPSTVSPFYPEQSNLSDCVGLVERPGCGSDARGGWQQGAIFALVAVGLAVIVGRVVIGVRRNREP